MTDTSGNVVATYQYDPYGNVTSHTGSVANPYQFGGAYGAYTDASTGLVKIGARYYDPNVGRWTQQDSASGQLSNPANLDRYVYIDCSPVNSIDSSGLISLGCGSSIAGLAGSIAEDVSVALAVAGTGVTGVALLLIGGSLVTGSAAAGGITAVFQGSSSGGSQALGVAITILGLQPIIGTATSAFGLSLSCHF